MSRKILIPLFLAFLATVSCQPEAATDVYVQSKISSFKVKSGEMMFFDIYAETIHNSLVEVKAELFSPDDGLKVVLDEHPGTREYQKRLEIEVPMVRSDGTRMEMRFSVKDDGGHMYSKSDRFVVDRGAGRFLDEASSIVLQSPATGRKDAFSLVKKQVVDAAHAEDRDLDVVFATAPEGDLLPLAWTTGTDVVFAKVTSFDYARATEFSVRTVLENSVRANVVRDLAMDDVILVGREIPVPVEPEPVPGPDPETGEDSGTKATAEVRLVPCGVFKILDVIDTDGTAGDRIIFSYKYI